MEETSESSDDEVVAPSQVTARGLDGGFMGLTAIPGPSPVCLWATQWDPHNRTHQAIPCPEVPLNLEPQVDCLQEYCRDSLVFRVVPDNNAPAWRLSSVPGTGC